MHDYLPWQLMQPAASTALLNEFLRWLSMWLLGVSVAILVLYLAAVTLLALGEQRAKRRAHAPAVQRGWRRERRTVLPLVRTP